MFEDISLFQAYQLSPVIYLFRGPILRSAGGDPDELSRQIWITLLHEIGHHFGLSEERLDELGYG